MLTLFIQNLLILQSETSHEHHKTKLNEKNFSEIHCIDGMQRLV
jgi:hypothetical protein